FLLRIGLVLALLRMGGRYAFLFLFVVLRREQGAAAAFGAAPAREFGQQLGRIGLVDHQAVVVVELFTGNDVAQRLDEDPLALGIRLAVGIAGVIDPLGGVAVDLAIDHMLVIDVKVEGVVRLGRIVRMPAQRLLPADHLAGV